LIPAREFSLKFMGAAMTAEVYSEWEIYSKFMRAVIQLSGRTD
jgi:hypothetical protein